MPAPEPFNIVGRYFWLLAIAVTTVNAAIWWHRAQANIAARPELEVGYRRLIRGLLVYGSIPWLVMGAGIVFGRVDGVFSYFNPKNGPYVVAWYASVVILWLLSAAWLFFMRGAEQLIEHPGLLNLPSQNPRVVKAFFLLCLAGGLVGLSIMLFGEAPVAP